MKKLWRLGVLCATICTAGFALASSAQAADTAAAKPEPPVKVITRENLHGIMMPDENNIWIVGNYGVIYHSSDAGETWKPQDSGVSSLLIDGVFLNATTGWVVGINGVLLHTTDGGATWVRQSTSTEEHLFGICFLNEKLGWAVGTMGLIIHTRDGGKTWEVQGWKQDKTLNNIAFVDETTGVAVGESGTMLRTVDGGTTWTALVPPIFERASIDEEFTNPRQSLYGIVAKDSTTFVACGIDSLFLYSSDAGATWESFTAERNRGVYSLFLKGDKGWAVGDRGSLFLSDDGGKTWAIQDGAIETGYWLRDIAFSTPDTGMAVGAYDTIVSTDDGGKTWTFKAGIYYTVKDFPVAKAITDKIFKPFDLFASFWRKLYPAHY